VSFKFLFIRWHKNSKKNNFNKSFNIRKNLFDAKSDFKLKRKGAGCLGMGKISKKGIMKEGYYQNLAQPAQQDLNIL